MEITKKLIYSLSDIMSVTGSEYRGREELMRVLEDVFDEYYEDTTGTHVFIKKCGRENAPRLMLDAHFDEIGMIVSAIHEDGYLSIARAGGLDRRILPATEVKIYGAKTIYGVICSTPPHLQKAGDAKKLPELEDILVDTGYSKEELEKIVRIGTPIGFYEKTAPLLGNRLCGRGMDNKCCAAAAVRAAMLVSRDDMVCDLYVTLSSREEESLAGGCVNAAYTIKPDAAIVTDVTFAKFPGVEDYECGKMGEGVVISLSAVTDKYLTRRLCALCGEKDIKMSETVDATDTGTNATMLALTGDGIPTAVVSVPLSCMHTYNEIIDAEDVLSAAKLFAAAMCDPEVFGGAV